jgi:hypothetical protein
MKIVIGLLVVLAVVGGGSVAAFDYATGNVGLLPSCCTLHQVNAGGSLQPSDDPVLSCCPADESSDCCSVGSTETTGTGTSEAPCCCDALSKTKALTATQDARELIPVMPTAEP